MGEVYLATHALLNRPTAVKLLRDGSTATARERFRQEVQVASGLTHPNTVEIYDYGRTPEGVFYFAMEYVEGATLDEVVRATGVMPPARVVHVLEQAAASLAEAHGRGLVHRDVKPSNLMLCERGGTQDTLKVMDFGLVHEIGGEKVSRDGVLTGTPLFLAPEAILDVAGATAESDVYALGVTAYFLLAGRAPFEDGDLVEILSDHLVTPPPPLDVGDVELVDLVMRCLAKEPAQRPPNARALLSALEACANHGRWSADDARIWWAEHGASVSSARATAGGAAQPGTSSRSTGEAGAST
jgi:serine/threonine-protein kinase